MVVGAGFFALVRKETPKGVHIFSVLECSYCYFVCFIMSFKGNLEREQLQSETPQHIYRKTGLSGSLYSGDLLPRKVFAALF